MLAVGIALVALALTAASAAPVHISAAAHGSYSDPRYARSTTIVVEGTVLAADMDVVGRRGTGNTAYAVKTDDGHIVPIRVTKALPANGRFRGSLVVTGRLAATLRSKGLLPSSGRTIDAKTSAGRVAIAIASKQATPVPVASATVTPETSATVTATPAAHHAYVAVMTNQGSVDGTDSQIGSAVDSMLSYWTSQSDGVISSFNRVGATQYFAPTAPVTPSNGCGLNGPFPVWDQAAALFPGVDFYGASTGNHLIVVVGDECGGTGPVGVALIGTSIASGGLSILTYSSDIFDAAGAHELGHNFGLQHANLNTCPSASICEYFDLYSPMALSVSGAFTPASLGTLYRSELGLTGPGEVQAVDLPSGQSTSTASYSLAPRADTSGQRGLLVTDPSTGTTYSVDYRSHAGRDVSTFYGSGWAITSGYPTYPSGVVVERQATASGVPDATYLMTHTVGGTVVGSFANGDSFSPDSGLTITVTGIGATATVSVSVAGVPFVTATPTVSGTIAVGNTVTAVPGTWSAGTSFTYDWRLDGTSTDSTGSTYAIPAAAAGKSLTVQVTGTLSGRAPVTNESAAATVANGTFIAPEPTVSGTVAAGQTVTAVHGSWSAAAAFTYSWLVDGVASPFTGSSYVISNNAVGKSLQVTVTGTADGYSDLTVSSATQTVAPGTFATSPDPTITGVVKVGATLTAVHGTWSPAATFAYAWVVGTDTVGTGSTFTVPASVVGKSLHLVVTGSANGYADLTRSSTTTTVANGTFSSVTPTITGTVAVGRTVTAVPGTWSPSASFTYAWKVAGVATSSTGTTFTIPATAVGKSLTLSVTGTSTGYDDRTVSSAAAAVVRGTLTSATPKISGTAKVGKKLTVSRGTWTPTPTLTQQWYANGNAIHGARSTSLTLTTSMKGQKITVKVTGTEAGYTTVTKTSASTAKVT
ncbi:MAG: hypothetical protein JWR83_2893 [Aeromicrobium sp.]|nr:hypothetical protein [Aeromicrobium sp.]